MTQSEFISSLGPLFPGPASIAGVLALAGVAALVLTPAERLAPAYRQRLILRKGFFLDVLYWFATPLLTRCVTGIVLALLLFLLACCIGLENIPHEIVKNGFGPISRQPLWLQCVEALVIADFFDYWTHRTFHRGPLWRIHAIHHSPEEMNWLSSSRVHPLNDLATRTFQLLPILLFGFAPEAVLIIVPLASLYVMFLHSNVKWDFGPLRWVFVSPAYHRWHHTSDAEGIDKNFAGMLPLWDVLFKTAHFPHRLPKQYGLRGYRLPDSVWAHLVFPFQHNVAEPKPGLNLSIDAADSRDHTIHP
jgi:sterol desaturase/sphingolipid hydroxylase (fatty acid hydroxylase superfamily)